jgi:hypothetical protein
MLHRRGAETQRGKANSKPKSAEAAEVIMGWRYGGWWKE